VECRQTIGVEVFEMLGGREFESMPFTKYQALQTIHTENSSLSGPRLGRRWTPGAWTLHPEWRVACFCARGCRLW
jgi:hypothetical protein